VAAAEEGSWVRASVLRGVLGSGVPTAVSEGDADGVDVAGAVLTGGGASGIAGEGVAVGAVSRWTGSAIRAATTHDAPTPAAARSTRRRAAVRRIAS
jgi:hypothetical protein